MNKNTITKPENVPSSLCLMSSLGELAEILSRFTGALSQVTERLEHLEATEEKRASETQELQQIVAAHSDSLEKLNRAVPQILGDLRSHVESSQLLERVLRDRFRR